MGPGTIDPETNPKTDRRNERRKLARRNLQINQRREVMRKNEGPGTRWKKQMIGEGLGNYSLFRKLIIA